MKKLGFLAVLLVLLGVGTAQALWQIANVGLWPKDWPRELEPLRSQARTFEHGLAGPTIYEIAFKTREDFERYWPHLVKLNSEEEPITLLRSPHAKVGKPIQAGIRIIAPPDPPITPAEAGGLPIRTRISIELIVDGEIVDLNRIEIPGGTPVIDERFVDPLLDGRKGC